jgi:hypothetical protein
VVRVPGYRSRGLDSIQGTQISQEVVGLERGPLSLESTIEELLERKSSGPCLETEITEGIHRADYVTPLYLQKLTLTSLTKGGCSVGIVRSRTQATEFVFLMDMENMLLLSHAVMSV